MHVTSAGKQGSGTTVNKKILILQDGEKSANLAMFVSKCFCDVQKSFVKTFHCLVTHELNKIYYNVP